MAASALPSYAYSLDLTKLLFSFSLPGASISFPSGGRSLGGGSEMEEIVAG